MASHGKGQPPSATQGCGLQADGAAGFHAAAPAATADASARCCACSAAASCCASNRRVPHSLLAASASSASPRVASCGSAAGQAGRAVGKAQGVCVPSDAAPRRRRTGPSCRPQGTEGVAVGCAHAAAQPASQLATGQREVRERAATPTAAPRAGPLPSSLPCSGPLGTRTCSWKPPASRPAHSSSSSACRLGSTSRRRTTNSRWSRP